MNLPDFLRSSSLNALKAQMGIPADDFGDLRVDIPPGRLTRREIEDLGSSKGMEVPLEEVVVLPDRTLGFKGQRVVLYIRDRTSYQGSYSEPRFHLANCVTLIQMKENNRFGRYVISNDASGHFQINLVENGHVSTSIKKLSVCQRCLDCLRFKGFSSTQADAVRKSAVATFSLVGFFERFGRSFHREYPNHTARTAPINDYPPDFKSVSDRIRERAGWRCQNESCRVDLRPPEYRRFLHAHHINGEKNDLSATNLQALCIFCHANTAMHHHLKNTGAYKEFLTMRPKLMARS